MYEHVWVLIVCANGTASVAADAMLVHGEKNAINANARASLDGLESNGWRKYGTFGVTWRTMTNLCLYSSGASSCSAIQCWPLMQPDDAAST